MKNKTIKAKIVKNKVKPKARPKLKVQNKSLRAERDEARETLRAISDGEVDAFLVHTKDGEKIFTLKSAEHPYRIMVEGMNEGAATVLIDGTIVYCNNKFAELLDKSASYICGEKIWPYIAKKDNALFFALFSQSLIKPAKAELFLIQENGSIVDVHVSLVAADLNGTQAVSMLVTDLTERKQNQALAASENLTRSILDQAAEAIIVCDSDWYITRANPEAQRIVGVNPVLLPFDKAFRLLNEKGEMFSLAEMKRHDQQTRGLSASIRCADQTVIEISMSISHINKESTGHWHVITLTDVTPIKRIEKLKAAKDAAETANTLKTSFLANMSHEIRTPLGAIVGFADLMKESDVAPEVRKQYLEIISRSGKALTVLIDDILDLSKIEAGGMDVENIDVSLTELMNDIILLFSHKTSSKGISLSVVLEENIPEKFTSDPSRLRQILVNIVGNAVKFTQKGQVEILVSVANSKKGDKQIIFRVRDTGAGLSDEQKKRIFAPFTQGDESTTRKFGGTGLGLVLSRRLAQALGGDVVLESSKPGLGSVFCISVSLNSSDATILPVLSPVVMLGKISSPPIALRLQGLKILVVDDSPDNQILFESLFISRGAQVKIAGNGREAVDQALENEFDLIIMDIQMPVLDGYSATKELRSKGYNKPIIALTAYAMKEEKERCIAAGCNAHLSKPINIPTAIETILEVLTVFKAVKNSDTILLKFHTEKSN